MKSFKSLGFLLIALAVVAGPAFAAEELHLMKEGTTRTETGKVADVDPAGKAIVVMVGSGKNELDVGTIVDADTKLTVKGKSVPIADLTKEVKPGDTAVLKYEYTKDDLYAKEIDIK